MHKIRGEVVRDGTWECLGYTVALWLGFVSVVSFFVLLICRGSTTPEYGMDYRRSGSNGRVFLFFAFVS